MNKIDKINIKYFKLNNATNKQKYDDAKRFFDALKEEIRKEINNTRLRYIKTDDLILDSGRGVYNVITLDNLDEVHRKNYAKEIIDIYYKYNFKDWYDFTKLDSDLKDIANKVTNIPVSE